MAEQAELQADLEEEIDADLRRELERSDQPPYDSEDAHDQNLLSGAQGGNETASGEPAAALNVTKGVHRGFARSWNGAAAHNLRRAL